MQANLRESSIDWPGELAHAERMQYLDVQPLASLDEFDRGKRWTRWALYGLELLGALAIVAELWFLWVELP